MKLWPHKKYITARAVILRDNKLLVFHRKRYDRFGKWIEYYSIPGGKLEKGESPEAAVVRELQEEMGVTITTRGLIAHHKGHFFEHYIYLADITEGEPHLMTDSEEFQEHAGDHNQYEVAWVDVSELSPENLKFYGMFHRHILAAADGKSTKEIAELDVPNDVY